MTRYLLAPARNLTQAVLAVIGLAVAGLSVIAATIVVGYPAAAYAIRGLAGLGRRLALAWGGIAITVESPGPAPTPTQREDGWYVYNNQLFRHRWFPAMMLRLEWLTKDGTLLRDWLWLAATPLTGGVVAVVPLLLLGGGVAVAGRQPWLGAALIGLGIAVGPLALRLHARWSRILLQPPHQSWWHRSGLASWVVRTTRAAWAAAGLAGLALGGFVLGILVLASLPFTWGWAMPYLTMVTRPYIGHYRRRVRAWTGADLPDPYRPLPELPEPDLDGRYRLGRSLHADRASAIRAQQYAWRMNDPATWRELLWLLTTPVLAVVSLWPAVLISLGFFGLVWQVAWWAPWAVPLGLATGEWVTPWYMWYAVVYVWPPAGVVPGWASVLVGLVVALAGLLLAMPVQRLRHLVDRALLGPTRATVLAQRVHRLTETRTDAVDSQAAELRRIERDLHDGAQARLVAVGLSLATIEQLLDADPVAARTLLRQARESSATALTELRDLVRGIHPPVLAERGLVDAVRAVALDATLPVTVNAAVAGRLAAAVESAAYFAVCEALTNAVRHSGASTVEVTLHHADGRLRLTVADDGHGGADPTRGTGLRGIDKRLGTFDGTLVLSSPAGGPTVLTMEIPCALSSPRTSTSSATA